MKSPKVYLRDSGLVQALLGIGTYNDVAGHPVAGASWEGFAIENLIQAAPERTVASFYRAEAGAEIDLLLEIPGHGLWAIEVKRSRAGRPDKGFYIACQDLMPDRRFVVNAGSGPYLIDSEIMAIGLHELAGMLAALQSERPIPADGEGISSWRQPPTSMLAASESPVIQKICLSC